MTIRRVCHRQPGAGGLRLLWLLLALTILAVGCGDAEQEAAGSGQEQGLTATILPVPTATLVPVVTLAPPATATATATPLPSPTPRVSGPPSLDSDQQYDPAALAEYMAYLRDEFVQPPIDVPVREAIMAAEGLNFILIPIPNEFQQRVSFVPHPAGEMTAVFVPDSTDSLLALLDDPAWSAALTGGYSGQNGASLGWFELKEILVGGAKVTYLVYRADPLPDRFAFSAADILHAAAGLRGLRFLGPIE